MVSIPLPRPPIRRRKLRPATLKLRLAATLIDLLGALAALALTIGAGVLAYRGLRTRRSRPERALQAVTDDRGAAPAPTRRYPGGQRFADALQMRPVKLGLRALTLVLTLRRAERRGLGFWLLGLCLVDAHSGGEPTRRQQLVREITRRLGRQRFGACYQCRRPQRRARRRGCATKWPLLAGRTASTRRRSSGPSCGFSARTGSARARPVSPSSPACRCCPRPTSRCRGRLSRSHPSIGFPAPSS